MSVISLSSFNGSASSKSQVEYSNQLHEGITNWVLVFVDRPAPINISKSTMLN
jgi:hypothetical protein